MINNNTRFTAGIIKGGGDYDIAMQLSNFFEVYSQLEQTMNPPRSKLRGINPLLSFQSDCRNPDPRIWIPDQVGDDKSAAELRGMNPKEDSKELSRHYP